MNEQQKRLAAAIKGQQDPTLCRLRWAVVDSVDGTTVGIKIAGSDTVVDGVRFMSFYTPLVADVVAVLVTGTDIFVVGALS